MSRAVAKAHSHAAEPDRRDFQIALSKFALLHVQSLSKDRRRIGRRAALNSTFDVGRWTLNASPARTVQRLLIQSLNSVKERRSHRALRSHLSTFSSPIDIHASPRLSRRISHEDFQIVASRDYQRQMVPR